MKIKRKIKRKKSVRRVTKRKIIKKKIIRKREKQKNSLSSRNNQLIEDFVERIGEIIPATAPMGKGLCFKNIAKEKRLQKYWKDLSNKKNTLANFFKNVYKYKPVVFRKIIRENISSGIDRRNKQGNPVLQAEMKIISDILLELGINMKKELKDLELPTERPLIISTSIEFQNMIKKVGINNDIFKECIEMFNNGHLNESIRKSCEKYEKLIKDISGLTDKIGKDLMADAFREDLPKIKINDLDTQSKKTQQEGFKFISMGIMQYIRNCFSHDDVKQVPVQEAFAMLCLLNYLYKTVQNHK